MRKGLLIGLIVALAAVLTCIGLTVLLIRRNGPVEEKSVTTEQIEETQETQETQEAQDAQDPQDAQETQDPVVIPGTWVTASIGYMRDGEIYPDPEWHVRFTDTEILYGHMIDDDFELDHTCKISKIEPTANGCRVWAERADGTPYTYMTDANEADCLCYYEGWDENAFSKMYRVGASIWKSSTWE